MQIDLNALESLQAQWSAGDTPADVQRLLLRNVEMLPAVYQSRVNHGTKNGIVDKSHVATLAAFLKTSGGDTDSITVLRVGKRNILIDGHHRLAAYKAQKRKDIPVIWFAGSPKEALVESGRENAKSRLPMTNADRQERAWALVCSGVKLSKKEIVAGAAVSDGRVGEMRRRLKAFRESGEEVPSTWREVLSKAWDRTDDDGESWKLREQVEKTVNALEKSLGPSGTFKSTGRLNILAEALYEWGPRAMEHVTMGLVSHYGFEDRMLAYLGQEAEELGERAKALREEIESLQKQRDQLDPPDF